MRALPKCPFGKNEVAAPGRRARPATPSSGGQLYAEYPRHAANFAARKRHVAASRPDQRCASTGPNLFGLLEADQLTVT